MNVADAKPADQRGLHGAEENESARVNQIYRAYFNSLYASEYYTCIQKSTLRWARILDFVIGLAAALGGGSGLGILANPNLAWVCGLVTAAAVVLTVAKGVWDWPGKIQTVAQRIKDYSSISGRYRSLVEDIQYRQKLSAQDNKIFDALRQEEARIPSDVYSLLVKERKTIQQDIKTRLNYNEWWSWRT